MLPQFGELPDISTSTGEVDELMETLQDHQEPIQQGSNGEETYIIRTSWLPVPHHLTNRQ